MTTHLSPRRLGGSGLEVSPLGMGTWAMGGVFFSGEGCHYPTGRALGYGPANDRESERAIDAALDAGITFFDTADAYGTGHAERVLGQALRGKRHRALIATKFGNTYDESRRELTGTDVSPDYIRSACQRSLHRLETDWIDLYQLHVGTLCERETQVVISTLEALCKEGTIRHYAWSTDDPVCGTMLAGRPNAVALQFDMNVFQHAQDMLDVCRRNDFAAIIRAPLAMGFLGGKYSSSSALPADDIRNNPPDWLPYFEQGGRASDVWQARLGHIREVLTSRGRTPAQGALAWIWAQDERTIPIPGIRTVAQAVENAGAMEYGPLTTEQCDDIAKLLGASSPTA